MRPIARILIVEDDEAYRQTLIEQLKPSYDLVEAATLLIATEYLNVLNDERRIDLILLDVEMPDGNGRDFCRSLRENGNYIPVIILSGSAEEAAIIQGLESGANDYVVKPFRSKELLARIETHIRLSKHNDHLPLIIGPYAFRPSKKLLIDQDQRQIRLTEKETTILRVMYDRANQTMSRQELFIAVWGVEKNTTSHTLDTHIYRLRQKIEPEWVKRAKANGRSLPYEDKCKYIVTAIGGYFLNLLEEEGYSDDTK